MWCVDGTSWKYIRLYFVPFSFQISLHFVEYHRSIPINKAENVLAHNPTWLNLPNDSKHFRPEVAVIFFSFSFSACTVWLTREPPCKNFDLSSVTSEICFCDVFISNRFRPIIF